MLHNIIFSALALGSALLMTQNATAKNPNIVIVLFDDIGYGQPQCYRPDSEFNTPNINRLAEQGMRFTNAHAAASNCTPSRYGLLTGRYPSRLGQFGVLNSRSKPLIPKTRMTIASQLKQQGYHTACIGKWHLGMNWATPLEKGKAKNKSKTLAVGDKMKDGPNAVGFDYFYGFTHARNIGTIIEQDQVIAQVSPVENQPMMAAKAIEYIEQRAKGDKPFFLYFPACPPHTPVAPAEEFKGKGSSKKNHKGNGSYADWVFQGDAMLGQIMDVLERTGEVENTLLIVTGDNGASKRVYPPLRDCKSSIYEGGTREPFIARWPGNVKPKSSCDATISLTDLLATTAEITGGKIPENAAEDSVSILPLLRSQSQDPHKKSVVIQSPHKDIAIYQGKWKLIIHYAEAPALYDLNQDLGETKNVAAQHPEVVQQMRNLLDKHYEDGRSTPGTAQKNEHSIDLGGAFVRGEQPKKIKKDNKAES